MRFVGTVSRGIRLPVVSKGADLVNIVVEGVLAASRSERDAFAIRDRDVMGVTESLLARAQGNYVTLDDIAEDVKRRVPEGDVALVFPILSRNRFYQLLRAVVRGVRGKVHIVLSYPNDEVGNQLIEPMNYYTNLEKLSGDDIDEKAFYEIFGEYKHPLPASITSSSIKGSTRSAS